MSDPRDRGPSETRRLRVVDSHTEGEPTRVVVDGLPDLGGGSVARQAAVFRERFDALRAAIVNEPRGHDALVGAAIVPSTLAGAVCGVVFFNNVGLLHACGHGTIGLARTLAHLGRVGPGRHLVETPVGPVAFELQDGAQVAIENVPSFRHAAAVRVRVDAGGSSRVVTGDVAWGGNWFFLVHDHGETIELARVERLSAFASAVRRGLEREGITGQGGATIDHVELFGPPSRADCDSKNFVLCPGGAWDRSPCGTGTSAKMACLVADGALALGQSWRQESVVGSRFVGSMRRDGDRLVPTIVGSAYVTAEATLLLDPDDPFALGFRA